MNELFPDADSEHHSAPKRSTRVIGAFVAALLVVILTVAVTLGVVRQDEQRPEAGAPTSTEPAGRPQDAGSIPLSFGAQDTVVDSVTIPAGLGRAHLLLFQFSVDGTPTSAPRAAMVSLRVECSDGEGRIEMQTNGKQSTNMFVARGGSMTGQALSSESDQELNCSLLASAPFIEKEDDGLTHLPVRADLRTETTDGAHVPALRWLDDATLVRPGTTENVLSRRIDDPASLDGMHTTVRLTSCTVVAGSRDGDGENKCQESMTGRGSSTLRMRVTARWLDDEGRITSSSTLWDETLAIDYNTHHLPWSLRQTDLGERAPADAAGAVIMVQVESLAGTPAVVHADGTDSVVTTSG